MIVFRPQEKIKRKLILKCASICKKYEKIKKGGRAHSTDISLHV